MPVRGAPQGVSLFEAFEGVAAFEADSRPRASRRCRARRA